MLRKIRRSAFLANMSLLMTGTAIAQLLTIITAPILTRLYTPEELGVFGLFSSIISILTVIITLRYELAIVIPKSNKDAVNVLSLSINVSILMTVLLLICNYIFGMELANILSAPDLFKWLWLAPISAMFIGFYNSLNYWSTRNKQFKKVSFSRITRAVGINTSQLGFGIIGVSTGGLIFGQIVGQIFGSITLCWRLLKEDKKMIKEHLSFQSMKNLARKYKDFPLFSSSQSLVNSFSQNAAPFLLASFFGPAVVGYYTIALRLIQRPANLIGDSFRQVYFQRISELKNNNKKISNHLIRSTVYLLVIGFIPVVFFFVNGPTIFLIIFGRDWYVAGEYAKWLVIWLYFWFVNRPSISTIQILGLQKYLLAFEIVLFILRTGGLYIISKSYSALAGVIGYSLIGAILTPIVSIATILYVLKTEKK